MLISLAGPASTLIFAFLYNNKLYWLINIGILILNCIPVYPFDGGRVIRAFLKIFYGEKSGIEFSIYLTNIFVIILFLFALFMAAYFRNFFFLLTSMYVLKISREEIKKDKILQIINYLQTTK